MSLLLSIVDTLYKSQTFIFDGGIDTINSTVDLPALVHRIAHQRTIMGIVVALMWISIVCVKFCFLAFFKTLIRQMPTMNRFWWIALILNATVAMYGFVLTIYYAICSFVPKEVSQASKWCSISRATFFLLMVQPNARKQTDLRRH